MAPAAAADGSSISAILEGEEVPGDSPGDSCHDGLLVSAMAAAFGQPDELDDVVVQGTAAQLHPRAAGSANAVAADEVAEEAAANAAAEDATAYDAAAEDAAASVEDELEADPDMDVPAASAGAAPADAEAPTVADAAADDEAGASARAANEGVAGELPEPSPTGGLGEAASLDGGDAAFKAAWPKFGPKFGADSADPPAVGQHDADAADEQAAPPAEDSGPAEAEDPASESSDADEPTDVHSAVVVDAAPEAADPYLALLAAQKGDEGAAEIAGSDETL